MNQATTAVMATILTVPKICPEAAPNLLERAKNGADEDFEYMVSYACSTIVGLMLQEVRKGNMSAETRDKFINTTRELIDIFHTDNGKDIDHQAVRDAIIFDLS
jgi:hypothetical protein